MIEHWLGQMSQGYKKAYETYNNRVRYMLSEGGMLQGEGLRELRESNSELGKWSALVMRAELTVGAALIASSMIVDKKSSEAVLVAGALFLFADAGVNFLQSLSASSLERVVEGESYVDEGMLQAKSHF